MTTLTAATPTFGGGTLIAGAAPASPVQHAGAFSLADIWRIIRQRMLFIILLGTFFTSLGVGGVLLWYFKYPGFAAEAYVQVTSLTAVDPMEDMSRSYVDNQAIRREIQNQALLVTGPTVLQAAIKNPNLRDTRWFREATVEAQSKNESVDDLLEDVLSVSPIRESNLIRVAATWRIPGEVPKIVNTVIDEYIKIVNKRMEASIYEQMQDMAGELERAQTLLKSKTDEIESYIQSSKHGPLGIQIDMEVAELQGHVTDLELLVENLRSVWNEMKTMRPEDVPIDQQMQELIQSDPKIQRLELQVQDSRRNLDLVAERFMANHSMHKSAKAAYETAFQNLESARAQRIVDFRRRRIEEAKRNYTRATDTLVHIKEKLDRALQEQRDKDNGLQRLQALHDEKAVLTRQFELLSEKKSKLEIQNRQEKKVRIEIVQFAVTPNRISSPNLSFWLLASPMLGFGLSCGLAFLLDLTDKSIRTPRDVSRTQLPVLGTIPSTDDDEVVFERVETACLDAPHSVVAEAFRSLRANLFFSAPAEQQGVILVTSPGGDNGKTTIATNLAISIALSGRRVLLVDANFRRAALPTIFPNARHEGLSNILIGQGQLRDYVSQTHVPGLDILGAGPIPPNPAELLGSSYLRDVIVDARSRYDQVIFDGPPVLLVSDAMVLAGAVDGCLLVCEYRRTSRGALQRSRTNLEAINARIFGAVLNKVEGRRGGYYRKQYRDYYVYQEPDEELGNREKLDVTALSNATAPSETDDYAETTEPDRFDDTPHGGSGGSGGADEAESYGIDESAEVQGLDELEDVPPTTEASIVTEAPETIVETAPTAETRSPTTPKVPDVELSDLDLGSLPDLSDLEQLDIKTEFDIETPPAPPRRSDDTNFGARPDEDALDLENLADEMEELDSEDFRIDDRFDLGDDSTGDDEPDTRQ